MLDVITIFGDCDRSTNSGAGLYSDTDETNTGVVCCEGTVDDLQPVTSKAFPENMTGLLRLSATYDDGDADDEQQYPRDVYCTEGNPAAYPDSRALSSFRRHEWRVLH